MRPRTVLLVVAALLTGCQLISGVNDLELSESASGAGAGACDAKLFPDSVCGGYCRHMCEQCYGEQYPTDEACLAACATFSGDLPQDNNVGCHNSQAVAGHCLAAGPSGEAANEAQICGAPCDNFCSVQADVCGFKQDGVVGIFQDYNDCTNQCAGYALVPPFDANGPDADTFECRFKYLLYAAGMAEGIEKSNACAATGSGSIPCDDG